MEGFIQKQARQFSAGDPMLAEDLAQEGRQAAIRHLRQVPDCPESHLVVQARSAIYHYRRKGSSVDGKLDARSRLRHYQVFSLEEPIADNGRLKEEAIGDPRGHGGPPRSKPVSISYLLASGTAYRQRKTRS